MQTEKQSDTLKSKFLGWQCRIRQIAMREDLGRPSTGMCPKVTGLDGEEISPRIVVLLNHLDPSEHTAYFKFQVQKNHDPNEVRNKGLTLLQSTYYQKAREFSDTLTSLFLADSALAQELLTARQCFLEFSQFNRDFRLLCQVEKASQFEPCREATIWHNRIFNTQMPNSVEVLKFQPDWEQSTSSDQ